MSILNVHKNSLARKLLQFQKNGLREYGKYLDQQLKASEGKKNREAYRKYIQQQIAATSKKIAGIEAKLKTK